MAIQDVNPATPGSAVADELQNILTTKRNQARQDMLDQINMQNQQSSLQLRQQQIESEAELRKERASEYASLSGLRQAQADKDKLSGLGYGPSTVDQDTFNWGSKAFPTLFEQSQNQSPTEDGTPMQPSYQFKGSPEYLRQQQMVTGLQNLQSDPDFQKLSPDQKMMRMIQVPGFGAMTGANNIGALMERALTSKYDQNGAQGYVYDDLQKKLLHMDGTPVPPEEAAHVRRDQVQFLNRSALVGSNRPAAGVPVEGTYTNPDGSTRRGLVIVDPTKYGATQFPEGFNPGGRLGTERPDVAPKVDTLTRTAWLAAGPAMFRNPADQEAYGRGQRAGSAYIDGRTKNAHVAEALKTALSNPKAWGLTADALVSKSSGLDPTEVPEFKTIWSELHNPTAPVSQ